MRVFTRLIRQFADAHENRRPTVEEMDLLLREKGYTFSLVQIKAYRHQAIEGMREH